MFLKKLYRGVAKTLFAFSLSLPSFAQATQVQSDAWTFLPPEPLFAPLLGDPREPHTSLTPTLDKTLYEGAVGATMELLRYQPTDGTQWGWGMFGAGYILLGQNGATFPMQAGDWFAGTYVSEAGGPFSFRLEFEHQSSH